MAVEEWKSHLKPEWWVVGVAFKSRRAVSIVVVVGGCRWKSKYNVRSSHNHHHNPLHSVTQHHNDLQREYEYVCTWMVVLMERMYSLAHKHYVPSPQQQQLNHLAVLLYATTDTRSRAAGVVGVVGTVVVVDDPILCLTPT